MNDGASPEWTKRAVLDRIKAAAASGDSPQLQVFVDRLLPGKDIETTAKAIIADVDAGDVDIGPTSRLGKSFVVRGSIESLERIARDERVTSVLEPNLKGVSIPPIV